MAPKLAAATRLFVAEPLQSETVSAPDAISLFIIGACYSALDRVIWSISRQSSEIRLCSTLKTVSTRAFPIALMSFFIFIVP